jgi:integrase
MQGLAQGTGERGDVARYLVEMRLNDVDTIEETGVAGREEQLKASVAWRDLGLVFPTLLGTPQSPSNIRTRSLSRILARAHLPLIRFHDLRHTAATLALSANVNPKIVSEMLGHTSVAFTLDTYSHVLPTMQIDAAAVMERVLAEHAS